MARFEFLPVSDSFQFEMVSRSNIVAFSLAARVLAWIVGRFMLFNWGMNLAKPLGLGADSANPGACDWVALSRLEYLDNNAIFFIVRDRLLRVDCSDPVLGVTLRQR
ncbi:hypothetical protein LJR220_005111 [Bradyrhizobium sp. LjRoot220]|uniref:hypothetical protein n=1 Tax=Bradyrhizobium sp. LjRoot220 TaxID=3342284 RepID=UPI003ECEC1E4